MSQNRERAASMTAFSSQPTWIKNFTKVLRLKGFIVFTYINHLMNVFLEAYIDVYIISQYWSHPPTVMPGLKQIVHFKDCQLYLNK